MSDVVVSATRTARTNMFTVKFERWQSKTCDQYHWDPAKHLTVPNPDYNSKAVGAVAPNEKEITVYHKNAIRIEKAGLAKSFYNESEPWDEKDQSVIGSATVTV